MVTGDDFGKLKLFKFPSCKNKAAYNKYGGHAADVTNVRFTHSDKYVISTGGGEKSIFQWKFQKLKAEDIQ